MSCAWLITLQSQAESGATDSASLQLVARPVLEVMMMMMMMCTMGVYVESQLTTMCCSSLAGCLVYLRSRHFLPRSLAVSKALRRQPLNPM